MKDQKKTAGKTSRRFRSARELSRAADAYFSACAGAQAVSPDGEPIFDKTGLPVIRGESPVTVTGLAAALGLRSRAELYALREKKEFAPVLDRALLRIEANTEQRLFESPSVRGAEFLLKLDFGRAREEEPASEQACGAAPGVILIPRTLRVGQDAAEEL